MFTTSPVGELAPDGTITVKSVLDTGSALQSSTPTGMLLPTCGKVTDLTTGASSDACAPGAAKPASERTISTGTISIGAGDVVWVEFDAVTNPSAPNQRLLISTSSDRAVAANYSLTRPGYVSGLSVKVGKAVAGVTGVTYTVTFDTSPTGGLGVDGTITLATTGSTKFPSCGQITDLADGATNDACAASSTEPGYKRTLVTGIVIRGGDTVEVAFTGVTVFSSGSLPELAVSTSSDGADHANVTI